MSVKAILQGQNDKTPKLYLDITKLPEKPSMPIAAGEEIPYSWAEINAIALSGDAESYFSLGSLKECNLSTAVLGSTNPKMMVIGINQDADGTVTFQTQNCLNEYTTFGSNAVWIGSTARQLCQDFYNACETRNFIKVVSKGTCPDISAGSSRNNNIVYNNETVFLPSEREMGLDSRSPLSVANSSTSKAECTKGKNFSYSYYNNNNSRIKKKGDNGVPLYYWERSRDYIDENRANSIGLNGYVDIDIHSYDGCLAPAFVIGNSTKPALIQDKEDVTDKVKEALNAADKDVLTDVSSTLNAHQVDYSMHVTSEEKSKIANVVNPNLLDNWYFARPVNQRGKTEPEDVRYMIDRWRINYVTKMQVLDGYIRITGQNDVSQIFDEDFLSTIRGKTVTFSVLYRNTNGTVSSSAGTLNDTTGKWVLAKKTYTFATDGTAVYTFLGGNPNSSSCEFLAAKLELGDTQTLAHQDEYGNWILNEIPNYGEELRKCQRYYWRFAPAQYIGAATAFGLGSAYARAIIPLPCTMRTSPALNTSNAGGLFLTGATGDIFNTSVAPVWVGPNAICVDFTKTEAFSANAAYFIRGADAAWIDISADL